MSGLRRRDGAARRDKRPCPANAGPSGAVALRWERGTSGLRRRDGAARRDRRPCPANAGPSGAVALRWERGTSGLRRRDGAARRDRRPCPANAGPSGAQKYSGAGGNRTPVRQGVTGCDTTIPGSKRCGYFGAGSPDTEVSAIGLSLRSAVFLAVSGLSLPSFTASVARLQ